MKKRVRSPNLEKRQAILKSAIELFYKKGYAYSSMDMISSCANVSKATIYSHFSNKEALFLEIVSTLKARFEKFSMYHYDIKKPLHVQLEEIAKQVLSFLSNKENIALLQIITIALIQQNKQGKKVKNENYDTIFFHLKIWLERAREDKKLFFDESTRVAHEFFGYLKNFAFYPQLYGEKILTKKEQDEVAKGSSKLILKLYGEKN